MNCFIEKISLAKLDNTWNLSELYARYLYKQFRANKVLAYQWYSPHLFKTLRDQEEGSGLRQGRGSKSEEPGSLPQKHPKKKGEKRGRKRIKSQTFKPQVLSNGDTKVELLTRSRNLLTQSGDKCGEHKN